MADKIFSIADGLHDELPSTTTAKAGRMLITTDRGEMYYEPEDKKRIQINPQADWQQNDETANDYIKNRPGGYEGLNGPVKIDEKYLDIKNTNIVNGNKTGSLRTVGSAKESSKYKMGAYAFAEGYNTKASGYSSHAEGFGTTALDNASHAEGDNTKASSSCSHAEGSRTTASGFYSHAEGEYTIASSSSSHAEGRNTKALGNQSHAEGSRTTAGQRGFTVTACEKLTDTTGTYTLSSVTGLSVNLRYSIHLSSSKENCGMITVINADTNTITVDGYPDIALSSSSSSNYITIVNRPELGNIFIGGNKSHTEGDSTTASSDYQHVQGKYNIADTANTYADIIGNGTSDETRSNAYTLDWNGNAWYAGDVYVGSTSGTNRDEGSKKLATQDYVDEEIANFDFIKIVTELPETGLVNRTYFVPKQDPATNDLYDEYMWVDGKWELITTKQIEVDLTEYVKHTDIDQSYSPTSENAQSGKSVAEAVNTFFSDNNMEFIKEITLTEDVGMIDILTKDEGIELRDTFIYCCFLCTEVGLKHISLRKDGGGSYYGYGLDIGTYTENHITNGYPHVFGYFIYPIGETGRVLTLGLEGTVDGNVNPITGASQGLMMHSSTLSYTYSSSSQKIDNLNMFLVEETETNLIKAGSKIWLFGRRVK